MQASSAVTISSMMYLAHIAMRLHAPRRTRATISLVVAASASCQRFAEGMSWYEIEPAFFQPARKSHVFGWYTTSGS